MSSFDDSTIDQALAFAAAAITLSSHTHTPLPKLLTDMTDLLTRRSGAKFSSLGVRAATAELTGVTMPSFHRISDPVRGRRETSAATT